VDEERLRESEERLRLALECGRLGAWDWDLSRDEVVWSEEAYRVFDMTRDWRVADLQSFMELVEEQDRGSVAEAIQSALSDDTGYFAQYRVRTQAGTVRWIEARGSVIRDAAGKAIRMMGVVSDITERKEAEDEARRARDAADAAARAKTEFLANMSHEIRTPLHAVIGMAGLLDQTNLQADQRECVETIRAGADHLLSVVDEILDFSKIEAGRVELSQEVFAPAACLRQAVSMLASRAAAKGLALRTTFGPDVPSLVEGDPARLRQILVNLVGNAIKFTARGSVEVSLQNGGRASGLASLRFQVADTGMGIPEDVLPRLFEPFEQGDASLTRRHGGTGLGLAISKRLVELMRGSIEASARDGGGSVFRFTVDLPVARERRAADRGATEAPLRMDLRVLLVEDNHINRVVALRMIEKLGLKAETACTGAEAVLACARSRFDVVFMDVQMPVMGGIEATGRIRDGAGGNRPWIVALTANAFEENKRACRDAGMNDFLTKPFTLEKLNDALRRAAAGLKPMA